MQIEGNTQESTEHKQEDEQQQAEADAEAEVEGRMSMPFEAVESLLQPFFIALSECQDFHRVERVKTAVFEKVLTLCTPAMFLRDDAPVTEGQQQDGEGESKQTESMDDQQTNDNSSSVQTDSGSAFEVDAETEAEDDDPLKEALLGNSRYIADRLFECAKEKTVKSKVRKLIYKLREEFEMAQFQTSLLLREMAAMDNRIPDMEFLNALTAEELDMENGNDAEEEEEEEKEGAEEEANDGDADDEAESREREEGQEPHNEENAQEMAEHEGMDDGQSSEQEKADSIGAVMDSVAQQIMAGAVAAANGIDENKRAQQSSAPAHQSSKKRQREHVMNSAKENVEHEKNGVSDGMTSVTSMDTEDSQSAGKTSGRQRKSRKTTNVFVTPMKRSDASSMAAPSAVKAPSAFASSKAVKFDLQGNQIQMFDLKQMIQPKESVNAILSKPTPTKGLLKRTNSPIVETRLKAANKLNKTAQHVLPTSTAAGSEPTNGSISNSGPAHSKRKRKQNVDDSSSTPALPYSASASASAASDKKSSKTVSVSGASSTSSGDSSPLKATPKKLKFSDLEKSESENEEKDNLPRSPRPRAEEFFDA